MPRLHFIGEAVRSMLDGVDQFAVTYAGAHGAATSPWNRKRPPSAAEAKAGNYPMGLVTWQGLDLRIENPAHTVREGEGEDGRAWRSTMMAHYGYIAGTRGADGDGVDVFLGPAPESEAAWILNQRDAAGGFDEHKVLAGFIDARQAEDAYRFSYSQGWGRYAPPIPVSIAQLRWWLQFADLRREFTTDIVPPEPDMTEPTKPALPRVFWDSAADPTMGQSVSSVLYMVRVHDADDGLLLDPMTMADITEGATLVTLDALVTEAGKLKPKMEALLRVMGAAAGEDVKPLALQLSEPIRRFGGVHVAALFELSDGQTITAWFHNPDSTPAKFGPGDSLVSWKWVLNKKDVTIVVAPESGQDLNLREVARRLMKIAAKNSAAFARANTKRAGVMAEIQGLRDTLADRQATLAGLHGQIEVAKQARDDRAAAGPAYNADEVIAEGYAIGEAIAKSGSKQFLPTDHAEFNAAAEKYAAIPGVVAWLREGFNEGYSAGYRQAFEDFQGEVVRLIESDGATTSDAQGIVMANFGDVRRAFEDGQDPVAVAASLMARNDTEGADAGGEGATADDEAMLAGLPESDHTEWEDKITTMVEFRLGATRSDAQGMVEAQDFKMLQEWGRGHAAEVAYQAIFGESAGTGGDAAPPEPDPTPDPAEALMLREVLAGKFDTMPLADLLTKIETAVKKLDADGLLQGAIDADANAAITHWAALDEKANG